MKSTCAIAHEFPEAFLAFGLHNSSLGSGALFAAHRASLAFLDNVAGFIELRPEILRAPRLGHGRDGGRYSGSRLPCGAGERGGSEERRVGKEGVSTCRFRWSV